MGVFGGKGGGEDRKVPLYIGTSGWQYAHWKERFYPREVPQRSWLEYYAEGFATVECNNAFYRLPELSTFEAWRARVPDGFVMAVKASRYLSHIKRLKDPEEPVRRLLERASGLADRLGPILLQLPPTMKLDLERLDETLACFPQSVRVAVEVRHPSWITDDLRRLLERHSAAFCLADSPVRTLPDWRTANWGYIRFHEGTARPRPCYSRAALSRWVETLATLFSAGDDVFVYFNNDPEGCAIRDAIRFADLGASAGLAPTRVPQRSAVRVA